MDNLTALTWWAGCLTLLVAVQTVAIAIVATRSLTLVRRVETTLDGIDRTLGPLADGATELIADLHALRQTAHRAEQAVARRIWPVVGLVAAGRAIVRQFTARTRHVPDAAVDRDARARFISEGGPIYDDQ